MNLDLPRIKKAALGISIAVLILVSLTTAIRYTLYASPLGADFFTFWLAGRAALVEGGNPYSSEVTLQSQIGIYGRPAYPEEDQVAFAYPPYSLLPILPGALLPYAWAEAYWLALNVLAISALALRAFPAGQRTRSLLYFLFYPVFFGLILGNFAVPLGTILAGCIIFLFLRKEPNTAAQIAGGFFLGWATCKPQFIWFFALVMVIIAVRRQMRPFLFSLAASAVLMAGISFLMVPDWPALWIGRVFEYAGYVRSQLILTTLLAQAVSEQTAWLLTYGIAAVLGLVSFYLILRWLRGRLETFFLFAWAGFCTYLLHPHGIAYEQISFLAPLFVWAGTANPRARIARWLGWFGAIFFSWVCFAIGKWVYHPADAWPVLWNGAFLVWLYLNQNHTSIPGEPSNANP